MRNGKQMRRSERIPAHLPLKWRRGPAEVACTTGDISAEGLFIRTEETIFPGSLMQVEVELPDGPLRMFVTAVFVGQTTSGRGIGVQIFVIGNDERRRWRRNYQNMLRERQGIEVTA